MLHKLAPKSLKTAVWENLGALEPRRSEPLRVGEAVKPVGRGQGEPEQQRPAARRRHAPEFGLPQNFRAEEGAL
jgi:hypothetical protein